MDTIHVGYVSGTDYKLWDALGLDAIMNDGKMTYVNQREDGFETLAGDWFIADGARRIIISGSFGNDHSPGASHYTHAEVYADEESYREDLAVWEAAEEYIETDDDEYDDE